MADDLHERVRRRAYQLWEDDGRPEGSDLRHWLRAAEEIAGQEEHETLQELIDEDDRHDARVASSGTNNTMQPAHAPLAEPVTEVEITTGKKPARTRMKRTEGA
jgi:hypothetical protein